MSTARVVLDTNCIISALIFSTGQPAWLRHAWQAGTFTPLASHDTAAEFLRVLLYPKFNLSPGEQEALMAEFLPYAETVKVPRSVRGLPAVRDVTDRIFLALASTAHADALVSGDRDLHAIEPPFAVPVMTAPTFAQWLHPRS